MHELRYQEQCPVLNKHCLHALFVSKLGSCTDPGAVDLQRPLWTSEAVWLGLGLPEEFPPLLFRALS